MVAQLAAIENQGEAEAAQLVAVNKVDPVIIALSLLFIAYKYNRFILQVETVALVALYIHPPAKLKSNSTQYHLQLFLYPG